MKFEKKELNLENGLTKEWLITNGIGGYASSTIVGANTRKYHGLLVAALSAPGNRKVVVSKIDESVVTGGKEYPIYTNICKNYVAEGYKYLESFEKDYIPIFTYQVEGITIKKLICMDYGKNTVCLLYRIQNQDAETTLKLAPLVNFRDFHSMSTNHHFNIRQEVKDKKVKIVVDQNSQTPLYMHISEGTYIQHLEDQFYNMYYLEEEKRGFYPEENHAVPGVFEVTIKPNEQKEISLILSMEENIEEINTKEVIDREIIRINEILYDSELAYKKEDKQWNEWMKDFIIATDNFIVKRPTFGLHTVIAGYHWFLDWGRDTLISFEGLLLVTKRYEIAKEVLLTMIRDVKYGLVPNGYSGYDNRPLYNSVDSSLLLFEAVHKYLEYTSDFKFVKEKMYPVLVRIIDAYRKGIDYDNNAIYLDKDYLLSSGTETTQNTWMDVKYGDFAVTPRNGKAVEINSMWYNALKILQELTLIFSTKEDAKIYEQMAAKCKKSFEEKFYQARRKCLYDVLGDSKIRPNQLFALSLTYPVMDPASDRAKEMLETVTKKLLTPYGLKTLAKGEKDYIEVYEGDSFKRDMSYHQGITWPWLLGLYFNSMRAILKAEKDKNKKKEQEEKYKSFCEKTEKVMRKAFYEEGSVGGISELYDSKAPYLPKGAAFQAWSTAEVLRIIYTYHQEEK